MLKAHSTHSSILGRLAVAFVLAIPFVSLQSPGQQQPKSREEFHAAVQACAAENNIVLPSPTADRSGPPARPSDSDRAVIDACLASKGIEVPKHGRGPGPGAGHGPRDCSNAETTTATEPSQE